MCGCMLMHAVMGHEGHGMTAQPNSHSQAHALPASASGNCLHCGYLLGQGYAFCPNCGMSLKSSVCPACGQKVDPNWRACAYCGSPLREKE
jgi:predicted amidophosphoribosyltransferase